MHQFNQRTFDRLIVLSRLPSRSGRCLPVYIVWTTVAYIEWVDSYSRLKQLVKPINHKKNICHVKDDDKYDD